MNTIPREYFDLVEEVRDDQTVHSVELVDEKDDYIPATEANDVAANYMDTLRMERCEGEQHTLELIPMPVPMSEHHVTADTIITLHECDGMTDEFLFLQPSHGEYLEELTKELM